MEELWKPYPKWKKPVINDPILFDSIYIKCKKVMGPHWYWTAQ